MSENGGARDKQKNQVQFILVGLCLGGCRATAIPLLKRYRSSEVPPSLT